MMTGAQVFRAVWLTAMVALLVAPAAGWADAAADAAIERAEAWVEREAQSVSARCELA